MKNISTCDRYNFYTIDNSTLTGLEGIPQNLFINLICWVFTVLIFTVLRKRAWEYGKIAFFKRHGDIIPLKRKDSKYNVWAAIFYGDKVETNEVIDADVKQSDKSYFYWICSFFRITDRDLFKKCGVDAVNYQHFQRYLIKFIALTSILSLMIILPINIFEGNLYSRKQMFSITTMYNISINSSYLWIHAFCTLIFFLNAILLMKMFSKKMKLHFDDKKRNTLMVRKIPFNSFKNQIQQHLEEAYSGVRVLDVQFAYDICQLIEFDEKRMVAESALLCAQKQFKESIKRPRIIPHRFGRVLSWCGGCFCMESVDPVDYYFEQAAKLRAKCKKEKKRAFKRKLGIAFITFETEEMASIVHNRYQSTFTSFNDPAVSSLSVELRTSQWDVQYAPLAENINWKNLTDAAVNRTRWYIRAFVVNLIVFVVAFFCTTPAYILNLVQKRSFSSDNYNSSTGKFFPTLIFWLVSACLPFLVYFSDKLIGHPTKTSEHHAVMVKTFSYLVVMVLILPSLGLTTGPAFISWLFPSFEMSQESNEQWQCVFMAENAAFYVNYVITSAFIGCGVELIRLPELIYYGFQQLAARSRFEHNSIQENFIMEFQFGQSYAWLLCVFAIMCSFSVVVPIILPFGFIYLFMKMVVDRYNLYYAYTSSCINNDIHQAAINCMFFGILMLQLNLTAYLIVRIGFTHPLTIVVFGCFMGMFALFVLRIGFGWFRHLGNNEFVMYADLNKSQSSTESLFVHQLLADDGEDNSIETNCTANDYSSENKLVTSALTSLDKAYYGSTKELFRQ